MLLRFLQKGLTFHNIPLMPGITAQDDENVVYSKQIGVEENNGKAPGGPKALLSPPWGGEQHSALDAPALRAASGQVGPGFRDGIGSEIGGHPPCTPLPPWLSRRGGHVHGTLLNAGLRAPASPRNTTLPV